MASRIRLASTVCGGLRPGVFALLWLLLALGCAKPTEPEPEQQPMEPPPSSEQQTAPGASSSTKAPTKSATDESEQASPEASQAESRPDGQAETEQVTSSPSENSTAAAEPEGAPEDESASATSKQQASAGTEKNDAGSDTRNQADAAGGESQKGLAELEAELRESLSSYDESLEEDRQAMREGRARVGSIESSETSVPPGYKGMPEQGPSVASNESGAGGSGGSGGPPSSSPSTRDPAGTGEDVVARQLRKAAEEETDPVMKEKIWEEYRRYTTGPSATRPVSGEPDS